MSKPIPQVKGLPIVGNLLPMLDNPHQFLIKSYKEYGEIFRFKVAHRDYVVMSGVDATRFLTSEGRDYFGMEGFWGKAFDYMECPHGFIGLDGEIHQHQRNIMKPMLAQNAFANRIGELAEPVESIVSNTSGTINVGGSARHMISNQVGFNLQGVKPDYKDVKQFIYYFSSIMNVYGMRKWPEFMLKTPKFLKAKAIAKNFSRQVISHTEKEISKGNASACPHYMDVMLPALREKPEWYGKGEEEMHAFLPFVASLDTVASTMGFMLKRLLENPEIKARVQKEVDEHFSKGIPDKETLLSMYDLMGLVRETLRLQPTGFGITRTATQDFTYKGYDIKKGQDILLFTTADHLNEKYFPSPHRFDIERYREPRNEHKQAVYAPFGKGPHMCLGAGLAELMMPLNMGIILYNWDIKAACDLKKVKLTFNPAPVLSDNFKIQVQKRTLTNR